MKLRLSRYRWQSSCFTVPGLQLEVWAMMPAWFTLSEACGCFSSQKPNFFLDYRWPYCPLVFSLCPTHKDLDYRAHISTEILFLPLHENAASLEHSADRESVFVSRAAVPYAPSKWVLIFFFFFLDQHSCSVHIPLSLFLSHVRSHVLFAWEKHKLGYYQFAFYK